ncbi:MFS transporter [Arthrobacter sp. ZGTC412]|uniref:MFS transporter n=1 Tax=Arthrobacter sp. ZGTC412 TaxID=2058900 RepID=UPI000CE4F4CA|nr:MFS transporter [Arthrobacter sp. ZGTC412]
MATVTATRLSTPRPWWTALLTGMASYLDAGAIVGTSIALVLYAPALGLNEWDFGALSALLTLCFATSALVGGRLGDRFGRRRVFLSTLILFSLGVTILTFATVVPMLYIGIIIVGLAIGADLPVSLAMAAEGAPAQDKGKMVALSGVLWLVGIASVTVISIFVGDLGDLGGRIIYGHLLVVAIVVLILRSRLPESGEWTRAQSVLAAEVSADHGQPEGRVELSSLRKLVSQPLVWALAATGLFYTVWNIGANTIGQFSTYLYVNVAGTDVPTASLVGLVSLPLGILGGILFMRIVDKPSRNAWFIIGTVCATSGFAVPLIFGISFVSLAVMDVLFAFGIAFAGETIYKVWTQELFPTLLRSTAQGLTIALSRYAAAAFALFTPVLAASNVTALLIVMVATMAVSGLIGILWVPRLKAAETTGSTSVHVTEADGSLAHAEGQS